jgi:hypothetical protein
MSESNYTPVKCFHKGYIQSNQQLASCQLMRGMHCSSTVFPYKALERRKTQETLTAYAGVHDSSKALNIHPIQAEDKFHFIFLFIFQFLEEYPDENCMHFLSSQVVLHVR